MSYSESSKKCLQPIILTVSEIPIRVRNNYLFINGVWYDDVKPNFNTYFRPLRDLLKESFNGVEWVHPKSKIKCRSRITASLVFADAPVRAEAQNIQNHSGKYACNSCEIES